MNPHNFICEWLEFVTLAKHLEKPDVEVISPEDVGWHAVVLRKRPHKFRKDVASDPLRKIGVELFIKVLDFVPEVPVLLRIFLCDIKGHPGAVWRGFRGPAPAKNTETGPRPGA
jgi:hypothetical protein